MMAPVPKCSINQLFHYAHDLINKTANFTKCKGLHINRERLWILDGFVSSHQLRKIFTAPCISWEKKCVSWLGCGGWTGDFSFIFASLENNIPALVSPLIFEVFLFIQSHKLAGGFYRLYISFQFQTSNSIWFLGLLLFWSLAFFQRFVAL